MTESTEITTDVLILGAGPVGMTLHAALTAGGCSALLLERRSHALQQQDPRALALSEGARQVLRPLQAWPEAATPIHTIHISQKQGFGRCLMDRQEYQLPALGYVVRYRDLAHALARQIPSGQLLDACTVLEQKTHAAGWTVTVQHPGGVRQIHAGLLVHAEGTPAEDPAVAVKAYGQHAVITEVTLAAGHQHRAWERFTPDGPLALLPLERGFSVVFTLPPEKADAVMAMEDTTFLTALQAQFGGRLRFSAVGPRSRYPLARRLRHEIVGEREVWIGNAAQTLHPVSGQGFNLGVRDAWQLAEMVLNEGVDRAALRHYAQARRLDRQGGAVFTDQIVRVFSNDFGPLKALRGLGLMALDLCPPARHFVAKRMIWGARAWP